MEIILDELKNNGIDLNMRTLSHHMIYLIGQHGEWYQEVVARLNPDEIFQVFDMMEIGNFGCAMTFLTLVYVRKGSEDQIRSSVCLVALVLKKLDLAPFRIERSEERSFIRRICEYFRQKIVNIMQYF